MHGRLHTLQRQNIIEGGLEEVERETIFQIKLLKEKKEDDMKNPIQLEIPCGLATGFPYLPLLDRTGSG